ncbi:SUF system Fe-S cluster assembly protein [Arenibaculum pallidiluteum]|uniref:SUF system Fe-S cluster assembly protein n=1 Tax=Arenibaculum pallidiluteum TaxID=2812559 RepID=UPI002E2E7364|nr:SUF system Fe-S cluster assembly protein [Arenibaculum pallidiluteum]
MSPDTTEARATEAAQHAAEGAGADAPANALMDKVVAALKTVYDPEIPVDIWELGLIYRVDVTPSNEVEIDMTLTAPSCPVAGEIPVNVQQAVESVDEVSSCKVELVWDPPWRPDMMSEEARVALDMY